MNSNPWLGKTNSRNFQKSIDKIKKIIYNI